MNRGILLACASIILLACIAPAIATAVPTPIPVIVNNESHIDSLTPLVEACRFVAVTETYLRSCGSLACEPVGKIVQGESVDAICTVGNEWALIPPRGYFCVAALIGNGGCVK